MRPLLHRERVLRSSVVEDLEGVLHSVCLSSPTQAYLVQHDQYYPEYARGEQSRSDLRSYKSSSSESSL